VTTDNALDDVDAAAAETFALRRGDAFALTADHVYVVRGDGEPIRIAVEDIVEVEYNAFDWFLAVLSVGLIVFGGYSTTEHVLGGVAFAVIGVVSLFLTYRKRGKLSFKVTGRTKPLTVFPERPDAAYEALRPHLSE
jgi:hypothetical protein